MGVKTWLQASCYTFSRLQQKVLSPPLAGPPIMPVWHNLYFRDAAGQSYYTPKLICKGVLLLSHVSEGGGGASRCQPPAHLATTLSTCRALPIVLAYSRSAKILTETVTSGCNWQCNHYGHVNFHWRELYHKRMCGRNRPPAAEALLSRAAGASSDSDDT